MRDNAGTGLKDDLMKIVTSSEPVKLSPASNLCKVLTEELAFQFAQLCINTGAKHPVYSPYRYQIGQKLKHGSDRTVTRGIGDLAANGWVTRLPQRKDLKRKKFGPLRLAPTKKLWVRIKRMIRLLIAEDKRRQARKHGAFSRQPKLATISYSSKSKRELRRGEEQRKKVEAIFLESLPPGLNLSAQVERFQRLLAG